MNLNSVYFLQRADFWHVALIVVILALFPLFRAAAVVLIGRCVKKDIAKLAIPLVLQVPRLSIFSGRKGHLPSPGEPTIDKSQTSETTITKPP
jgi:hypothetical protein